MNLLQKLFKKNKFPITKHEIELSFSCGGRDYFQFKDFDNIPALRGLKTMVFYEELRCKCTLDFLRLHAEAIDNILALPTINVFNIKKLNDQLKQRLDLALDTELLYKIAAINFFDKNENVEDFDFGYNARKVEHWKKYGGADFFFETALTRVAASFKGYRQEFKRVFPSSREDEQPTFGHYITELAGKQEANLRRQELFFVGGDAWKLKEVRAMTIYDYLFALNEKLKPPPEKGNPSNRK